MHDATTHFLFSFFLFLLAKHFITPSGFPLPRILASTTGVAAVAVGHPMDLIKVRLQTEATPRTATPNLSAAPAGRLLAGDSAIGMLRNIAVTEGLPGLYRGVQAPLLAVTPAFAISFWSYDVAAKTILEYSAIQREEEQMNLSQVALAGGFSGIPLAAIVGPTERIKCLMQVEKNKYNGFMDCLRTVYRGGGIRSVFRGTCSTALRDVPGNAAYFATYEFVKRLTCQLEGREKASMVGTLLAGGCAGVGNWCVAMPFDTIKSRWQTSPVGKYQGLLDVLQTLVREEGPNALYRGLSPALLRAFPANAACLCGVESVKSLIEHR